MSCAKTCLATLLFCEKSPEKKEPMLFVAVRDLRMHYEMRGTGPRLLCISGTGGDLRRSPNKRI